MKIESINLEGQKSSITDSAMAIGYADFIKNEIELEARLALFAQQKRILNLVLDFLQP